MKWKVEHDRQALIKNFERREGWSCSNSDNDWNIFWASTSTIQTLFHPEKGRRLNNDQVVNHFPNYYELTRKDTMVKNIKRYIRDQNRRRAKRIVNVSPKSKYHNESDAPVELISNFLPTSYTLPFEYNIFVEEFRRSAPNTVWIMKPCNGAQGKGIFMINKLDQVKKWNPNGSSSGSSKEQRYVVSKYINNPLLIAGKKFDLRIYVLITSFIPLKIFLGDGFARLATSSYTNESSDRTNPFVHLTNVSIQKKSLDYNNAHGGKWNISNLRLYLEARRGYDAVKTMDQDIDKVIVHSAKAVQNVINNDKHCFECYGYDLLIDENLKPWLIEINSSPSLSSTTPSDRKMKMNLIRDALNIVVAEKFNEECKVKKNCLCSRNKVKSIDSSPDVHQKHKSISNDYLGDFILLYDEAVEYKKS